jgi:hypothetical protein
MDFFDSETNKYVDKSHIFFNANTSELYVMFDGYFNQPINNLKEILYRMKYDSEVNTPHEYFNFKHTLFSEFSDTTEYDNCTYNISNYKNKDDKYNTYSFVLRSCYSNKTFNTLNHYLYHCF